MKEPTINSTEFVDQAAAIVRLPLPAEYHPNVVENFARITAIADLVLEFPLPEDIEIAPVFAP